MKTEIMESVKDLARNPYAWPGGYPKFAIMDDGAALCPACVKREFHLVARSTRENACDGWHCVGVDINWEDAELACSHCDAAIPAAYA